MSDHILAQTNWKTLKNKDIELAILPWGATEAHNYHLPYGTDTIETEHIAWKATEMANKSGAKAIVLPAIPFGVNTGQTDIKLTINLNPGTQALILDNIIENLNKQNIRKFLIMNGHGGNDFKQIIRELGLKYSQMFISSCKWFQAIDRKTLFTHQGDHADEAETSLMLYLTPHLVRPLKEAGEGKSKKFKVKAFNEKWAWAERKWTQVTQDTGIGNPKLATKEKGEQFFNALTEKISRLIRDLSLMDMNDIYE